MNHRPTEPPIPAPLGFPKSTAAARRTRWGRAHRIAAQFGAAGWIASVAVVLIAAVPCLVVLNDSPARGAADRAAVGSKPTTQPGIPVPQTSGGCR